MRSTCRFGRISLLLAIVAAAAGCSKATLESSVSEIRIGNDSKTVSFTISASSSWIIEPRNTWVTPSPSEGSAGTSEIVLSAVPNTTGEDRSTDLVIKAGRAESETIMLVKVIQEHQRIFFSTDTVLIPKQGGSAKFKVFSEGPWTVIPAEKWVTGITPKSGNGDDSVTVSCSENKNRRYLYSSLIFKSGQYTASLVVAVEPQDNQRPDKTILVFPQDGAKDLTVLPTFQWRGHDPDGDTLKYTLQISEDKNYWEGCSSYETKDSLFRLTSRLQPETTYYWRVFADDGNKRENSVSESDINTFTTSSKTHYFDLEYLLLKKAKVSNGVNLVFTGDGYVEDDFLIGGNFISAMEEGVEALFATEPYKEYADYFNVYVLAAYSKEQGMTITGKKNRDTRFKVVKANSTISTEITCSEDSVFKLVKSIPVVTDESLRTTPVFLMSNESIYAGTCLLYLTGESISIIPVSRLTDPDIYSDYASILLHEGGGHGFGRCADEYITHNGQPIPETSSGSGWSVKSILQWQSAGALMNVSVSKEKEDLPWTELVGKAGYDAITNPQGGCYYEFGVWRSEKKSCMIDNMHYFSAAQRLAIVKRLKEIAKESFSLEEFMQRDCVKTPPASVSFTKEGTHFVPLAPPVMKERRTDKL